MKVEVRSCVKVEVAVVGSPSLISLIVSVDVTQHSASHVVHRAQELCESRGGRCGFPVPNKPDSFCGRNATLSQPCSPQSPGAV